MNDFLISVYQDGYNDSQIDLDELREVIGSVSGISEVRLNQIMDAIAAHSDEWTAIFYFRTEKKNNSRAIYSTMLMRI